MFAISDETLGLIEDVLVSTLGPHYAGFDVSPPTRLGTSSGRKP